MKNVRIWFKKGGSARYISHLDLTRCMSRALRLSRLPVWYTEGFNPRVYMTFGMPLSLGVQGERECMDIRLTEEVPFDQVIRLLNEKLPEDIRALEAAEPVKKLEEAAFADYEILFAGCAAELESQLLELFSRPSVPVMKKGKKGDREFDLKPAFSGMRLRRLDGENLLLCVRLPCGPGGSVNPGLLLEAVKRHLGAEPYARITRNRLLDGNFSEIR